MPVRRSRGTSSREGRCRPVCRRTGRWLLREGADNDGRVLDKVPGAVVSFETVAKPDMLGGIVAIRMTSREKGLP